MAGWLLLAHKVPREPTAHRVGVWRKLKRLGASLVHDSVWVLPATPRTREQLQWLATEIEEAGGEVMIWESTIVRHGEESKLRDRFVEQVELAYREILDELKSGRGDLTSQSRRFRQLSAQDYFGSDLGRRVRDALVAARGGSRS